MWCTAVVYGQAMSHVSQREATQRRTKRSASLSALPPADWHPDVDGRKPRRRQQSLAVGKNIAFHTGAKSAVLELFSLLLKLVVCCCYFLLMKFLANVNSRSLFAVARPSVCRL